MDRTNKAAKLIRVVAIIMMIIGFIAGLSLGMPYDGYGQHAMDWGLVLRVWTLVAFSGCLLVGFSEIIHLLQTIASKQDRAMGDEK